MGTIKQLVTIITVTRNRAHLLKRAITSVLKQTYKNIEYIIIDGASEDNTTEIVANFKDVRIKYVRLEENENPIDSLWHGFKISKGDFITFLDDDDEYLPTKIEKQLYLLKSLPNDYGFVYCWMNYYDTKNNLFLYTKKSTLRGKVGCEVIDKPELGGTPTLFFRKHAFRKLGGWRKDIGIPSDWELRARAANLFMTDFVPEVLVNVYINHESTRQSNLIKQKKMHDRNLIFHESFLKEFNNCFDKYPKKKLFHLRNILYYNLKLNQYKNAIKTFFKISTIKIFDIPTYKKIINFLLKR